jgi:hypothetical protein
VIIIGGGGGAWIEPAPGTNPSTPVTPPPVTPNPVPPVAPTPQMEWTAIGGFQAEFQTGAPAKGWKYMWTAGGKTGNASTYKPLTWSSSAYAYNTTGAATPVYNGKSHPDDYLQISSWGGHPGQPGYSVIAAYTIQAEDGAGQYRLASASIMKNDAIKSSGEDGLTLQVFVNNSVIGSIGSVPTTGLAFNFARDLGNLNIGDTIYVVLGAGANQSYDGFKNFDFLIQKLTPVATALASMMAVPEPATGVQAGVLLALAALRRRRR